MKRIIITNNPLLKPLYGNLNKNKFTFSVLSEITCVEAINKNEFDLALISPLIYASINSKEDIKILPTKMLVLEDFTKTVAINIRQNKESLSKIFFHTSNEFIIVATKLVLCERFNIVPELTNNLEEADIIVNYGDRIENCLEVNLSEDWYDTFEVPLVMGFWVFKDDEDYNSENYKDIIELVSSFANSNLESKKDHSEDYQRYGKEYWEWKKDFLDALEKIFDVLYYYGYAHNIVDAKLLSNE
jgi:hypothetical protein